MACGRRVGPEVCSELAKHTALFCSETEVINRMFMNLVHVMTTLFKG